MAKRLFLLLFSACIGIIGFPEILMASDGFDLVRINDSRASETVVTQKEAEETIVEEDNVGQAEQYKIAIKDWQIQESPAYVEEPNTIVIAGRKLDIVDVASTAVDSGSHVNKYRDKFLYGHNTAGVFGGIVSLGAGSMFSVTYDGVSRNYVVAKTVIYEKNIETGKLQLNGAGSYMGAVADARSEGVKYDLSLMTCYGVSYGNGDASHRFVIFANEI